MKQLKSKLSTIHAQLTWLKQVSSGQRKRIVLSCLTGIAGVIFSLAFVWATKQVIDIATGALPGSLTKAGLGTIVLLLLQLTCNIFDSWLNNRMQVEGGNALRRRVFSRLLQSHWNELERFHTGDVVNRIEQDTTVIVNLLTTTLPFAVVTSVQLAGSFVFFCMLDKSLPWLIVAILPVFLLSSHFYMKRMRNFTRNIRHSDSRIQSIIQESLQHRTVIKTLEQSQQHLEKLDHLQSTLQTQVNDRTRFSIFSRSMVALAFSGGYLTAFLWGAMRLSLGTMTFGTMTAFLQLVGKVQRPVLDLVKMIPATIVALTAIERLMELEALPSEEEGEKILFPETPDLLLRNVSFAYNTDEKPIFDGLFMHFPAGSRTAIVGETGKGKTTLIRLLLALVCPQQGFVTLRSRKYSKKTSALTRCNFVYVPQGNTLFSGSIRDNLLMGNPKASEEEMNKALQIAAADFVFTLPYQMDTLLTEQGGGLSEGQAQRIAIARALLRPGSILLLDEATSALDSDTEKLLMNNLAQHCKNKTVIFITHHTRLAEACERIYRL